MTAHIWVYGIIGTAPANAKDKYYSFPEFQKELDLKATDYVVHILSPGGDVYQGQAMYNALINTGKKIRVQIEGLCASIATLVAASASPGELVIQENSQFMIHNPRFDQYAGDARDLRTGAAQLDQIKTLLISAYKKRTGLPEAQLWKMYDNTTWLLPDAAKEMGFVDAVVESYKAVAFADYNFIKDMEDNKLSNIEKLLNKVVNFFAPKNVTDTLADGTVITVESEDGDWTGKRITREDGSELEPGEYPLADGRVLVIGDGSTISEVREAAPVENKVEPENEEAMYKEKFEAAEARIKELESALEASSTNANKAEARAKSAENKVNIDLKNLQAELEKIKNTTAGDQTPPKKAINTPINGAQPQVDPMQAWFKKNILDVRNTD